MKRKLYVPLTMVILTCWLYSSTIMASPFERRRDQFQNTPGSLFLPFPYSIPGVGEGTFLVGSINNISQSSTDMLLMGFTGDAEGYVASIDEFFVIPSFLYVSALQGKAARFGQNVYKSRGMDNEKEDFNIFVGKDFIFKNYNVVITLFDRRLELSQGLSAEQGQFIEIRDFEGEPIQDLDNPIEVEGSRTRVQVKLDLTDDYNDPRSGLNIRSIKEHFPAQNEGDPEYETQTSAVTLYIPVLKESTLVFHYFRSDATVIEAGNTDLESLKEENGFSSCDGQAACVSAILASAQNQLNANKNGTARGLGGSDRLRSYPLNRYQAAHAELFGVEFRWNFKTGGDKIDLFFLEDIIDSLQLAIFAEQGSVSEEEEDLGTNVRGSYGAGLRFIGQSGAVYRIEVASGDEGSEFTAFFEYPWSGIFD